VVWLERATHLLLLLLPHSTGACLQLSASQTRSQELATEPRTEVAPPSGLGPLLGSDCLTDTSLCYSSAVMENSILKKSTFSHTTSREEHSCHYLQKMKNQIVNVVRTKLHEWRISEYQLSVKNSTHES